jgi:hypothetical protein
MNSSPIEGGPRGLGLFILKQKENEKRKCNSMSRARITHIICFAMTPKVSYENKGVVQLFAPTTHNYYTLKS